MDNLQELSYLLAEDSQKVVFVFGAGLSKPAGIPGWDSLNDNLIKRAENYFKSYKPDKLGEVDSIKSMYDNWLIGSRLKQIIPRNHYIDWVRDELGNNASVNQTFYKDLLSFKIAGIINYNLDLLCREYCDFNSDTSATGIDFDKYGMFFLKSKKWLLQPHGSLQQPDSWVLTQEDKLRLLSSKKYQEFIRQVFQGKRIVLWGFNPKDISFESLLIHSNREHMCSASASHFWISPDMKDEDKYWCKSYNIKPICYNVEEENHEEIKGIIDVLKKAKPREYWGSFSPEGEIISTDDLPEDNVLRLGTPDQIRKKLNAASKSISSVISEDISEGNKIESYIEFLKEYPASLQMAWLLAPQNEYKYFYSYQILKKIDQGAFGEIYLIEDKKDNEKYVVKVLRKEYIDNKDFIEAFRRGIIANKLLTERNIKGMVPFKNSFEVPPSMIMDYIDGPTLEDVVKSKQLNEIKDILGVFRKILRIINEAHSCKDIILHRDIKPTNIMLENYYDPRNPLNVIILDFDLSWYKGAIGKSLLSGTRLHSYAAPEQISETTSRVSTKNTAVDIYSLGMLLYFMITREDPSPGLRFMTSFAEDVKSKIESNFEISLKGISSYLAEIIIDATPQAQDQRSNLTVLINKIEDLYAVLSDGKIKVSSPYLFIELASRLDKDLLEVSSLNDSKCILRYNELDIELSRSSGYDFDGELGVKCCIKRTTGAAHDRKRKGGKIQSWAEKGKKQLKKDNIFVDVNYDIRKGQVEIIGFIKKDELDFEIISKASSNILNTINSMLR